MRYAQLDRIIDEYKPSQICEIGVARGDRADQMIRRALKHHRRVTYTGFDLFEHAKSDRNRAELNGKQTSPKAVVEARLRAIAPQRVDVTLVQGDSKETVPEDLVCDLVFVDGGHSVETIASDYSRVKGSKVVVMDDYYMPDKNGRLVHDIGHFGCNFLVDTVSGFVVLPETNSIKGGGRVAMAVMIREEQ